MFLISVLISDQIDLIRLLASLSMIKRMVAYNTPPAIVKPKVVVILVGGEMGRKGK